MNEIELARLVDGAVASQTDCDLPLVLLRDVSAREADLANRELERRGSKARVMAGRIESIRLSPSL